VAGADLMQQVVVVSLIALVMTIGVYGLVAGIVKLDDLGLYLANKPGVFAQRLGNGIVAAAPYLMKSLSFIGTAAMFMVGGGILTHGLPLIEHAIEDLAAAAGEIPAAGVVLQPLGPTLLNMAVGLLAGALILAVIEGVKRLKQRSATSA
jgi:predicted DNA repair protein MutK